MAVSRNKLREGAMNVGGIIAAVVRGVVSVMLAQTAVAHAGEINVVSRLNEGTTFTLSFPKLQATQTFSQKAQA